MPLPTLLRRPLLLLLGERLGWPERVARIVAMLACVWFALAAAWGLFGIVGSGHVGAMSGTGITGENILKWKIWGPVWRYSFEEPKPAEYFCHHPFGAFWVSAIFVGIFGHHHFVLSLPAVLMSAATPPLLYKIAKAKWGVIPGAAAACGFAVLPITLGFANFHNLEVAVIFGWVLFFWGHVRLMETPKKRYFVASLLGILCACSSDWPGYIAVGVVLGWGLFRAFILPARLFERFKYGPYARWWALSVALSMFTLILWIYLFNKADKLGDWLASATTRGGDAMPLEQALLARKSWIEVMFTPIAILIGKLALPVCVVRLIVFRRDVEVYSLALWLAATVQYVVFKRGADVHIFWPHYFGAYFALALAELVATLLGVTRWALARVRWRRGPGVAASFGLALFVVPCALILPDGVRGLRLGRATGGRYNNTGTLIRSEHDLLVPLEYLVKKYGFHENPNMTMDVSQSISWSWEHSWILKGVSQWANVPARPGPGIDLHPLWLARASGIPSESLMQVAASTHARLYGDLLAVDVREPQAPLDAYSLNEREPTLFEWYFLSGVEPHRSIGEAPDPFLTWEWRVHLDQPASYPALEPTTLDEERIMHNVAVAQGDTQRAEAWRAKIEKAIDRTVACKYDQGMRIFGVRITQGADPRLEVWFEAAGPSKGDATFAIHSVVEERDPLSSIPADATERDMAFPPPLSPRLWKNGFVYKIEQSLMHRVGRERYWGFWVSRDAQPAPRRVDDKPFTNLAVIR